MGWYLAVLKKYAVFAGRARRKEYWMFVLFNIIFSIVASIIDQAVIGVEPGQMGIVGLIYSLAVLLPGWGVSVRRLHDVGKSGWFIFVVLIPIAGLIWLLVLVCSDSNPGDNQYGPNPKAQPAPADAGQAAE